MRTYPNTSIKNKTRLEVGSLLMATPFWQEDEYKRSIVLVVKQDEEGSTGIILNKLSNLLVSDALPDLNYSQPLYYGGPLGKEYVSFVHGNHELTNSMPVSPSLSIGGDLNLLNSDMKMGTIKFYAGFVQWVAGQLEQELKDDKWWLSNIDFNELFMMPMEKLWQYKLLDAGHIYGMFEDCPDPILN